MRKFLFLFVLFFVISPSGAEVVQEGLVLVMDAAKAGSSPAQRWCPAFGSRDSGDLFAYWDSDLPTHHYEAVAGGYLWYYNFAPVLTGRSGVGGYIGVEDVANPGSYLTNFDYDADFSIEAWIRPGAEPIEQDRGIIISDQAGCNGWRLGIRDAGNGTWYFDFVMRDCSGTTYYILLSSNGKFNGLYNSEDWVHVILTYDGRINMPPVAEMYVNGVDLNINQSATDMSGASDTDFVPVADHLTIGVRDWQRTDIYGGMLPFDGDISLVQIYNKVLTAGEAVNNYAEGMTVNEGLSCGSLPGDLNSDCSVDLFDLLIMSNRWLVNVGRATWPYKVLFNNDTTNITTALSPYNTIDDRDFTVDKLRANIEEVAGTGVEVFMICPAHTWVPWWQSDVYSIAEHYQWYEATYGIVPGLSYNEYVLNGGDILQASIDRCREKGLVPFVTYRMNDAQLLQRREDDPPVGSAFHFLSKFYIEHVPDYCVGTGLTRDEMAQNFAIAEVRQHRLDFIREMAAYDIDGIELDFHRHCSYFKLDETTVQQRRDIMAALMADIRGILDESSAPGQHRWFVVRVPCYFEFFDKMGLDLEAWVAAGVDIVTASGDYFTVHDSDIAAMIKMIPGTPVLLEMHYTTCSGYDENGDFSLRRTTDNQFYTAAHLAYSRGAAGISTYNFQYYRASEEDQAGYFSEPPFRIFEHIADADWVAAQPQHYVLATTWMTTQYTFTMPLKFMTAGDSNTFEMDMAPPRGGWTTDGKLKIQAFDNLGTSQWTATCNGVELIETSDVSEPYNNPYQNLMDSDTMRRAWIVPSSILVDGINHFELTMNVGTETAMVRFIDLSI